MQQDVNACILIRWRI